MVKRIYSHMNFKAIWFALAGFFTLFATSVAYPQLLTADQAVTLALENNYSIRISKLDETVLQNNLSRGNAGFLPTVDLSAGQSNSITNTEQEYLSGATNNRDNAKANALTAGASVNWTFFNGLRMFNTYDQLKHQLKSGELNTKIRIESTIAEVLSGYYNIIQLKQKTSVLEKAVKLGEERVEIANEMLMLGAGSRLGLLQAEVDLNTDKSLLLNLKEQITEASISLNVLMARDAATVFTVEDTIVLLPQLAFSLMKAKMEQSNPELRMSELNVQLAMLNLRDIKGRRSPVLGLNLGYNYNDQSSESGFLKSSRSTGFNYGISANLNVFDGFNLSRQQQNARVGIESAELQHQSYLEQLSAELLSAYAAYTSKLQMVLFEKQNLQTALINFEIAGERFGLGELSGFEFREAQKNQLSANERLINAIFEVRLLEISLKQLSGSLLDE